MGSGINLTIREHFSIHRMAEPKSTSSTASPNNNTSKTQIDSMSLSEILLLRAILNDGPSTPPEELTAEKLKE